MKEKNLLYLIAIMFFILFSTLTVLFIESRIARKEMSFHWGNEQIITRLFQAYHNNQSLDEIIKNEYPTIHSIGFYNYYGNPIYTYGDARTKFTNVSTKINFNKKLNTIMIERDFTSPYDPLKTTFNREYVNGNLLEPTDHWSAKEKEYMIRYVALDAYNSALDFYTTRFRIIQILVVILILIIVLFLVNIYIKNIKYRSQIESTERLVVLGTAARTLSHEIKNPLSIIRLQSSIIKRSGCDLHNPSLTIINDEVSRITELTERVTDFLRHPVGYPETLDVNDTLTTYIEKKNHEIILELPIEHVLINIDRNRFISILDNLTNNAIESGSETANIKFSVVALGKSVQITLEDKGKGIKADEMKKLTDPFYTTKSKGSGLGLSIISSYVQAVDGTIKIKSEPELGTSLTITFPIQKIEKDT